YGSGPRTSPPPRRSKSSRTPTLLPAASEDQTEADRPQSGETRAGHGLSAAVQNHTQSNPEECLRSRAVPRSSEYTRRARIRPDRCSENTPPTRARGRDLE